MDPAVNGTDSSETQVVIEVNSVAKPADENGQQVDDVKQQTTAEQEEELKLRSKYPNPHRPGSSAFVQKLLHKGNKKYFDSGDYNMARSKMKNLSQQKPGQVAALPNQQQHIVEDTSAQPQQPADATTRESTTTQVTDGAATLTTTASWVQASALCTPQPTGPTGASRLSTHLLEITPNVANSVGTETTGVNCSGSTTPSISVNSTNVSLNSTPSLNTDMGLQVNTKTTGSGGSHSAQATPQQLPAHHSNTSTAQQLQQQQTQSQQPLHPTMSSSVSASSIHHLMLSSSLSYGAANTSSVAAATDKLSGIQLNNPPATAFLDGDEIGHGIPTPECLPQSRKHSIAQSKLATPRLSTS